MTFASDARGGMSADQLLREFVECADDTTPEWPPEAGDKVLGREVTGNPGPTYVLTDPYRRAGDLFVTTVSHHQLTAVVEREHYTDPIENPVKKARKAVEADRLSPITKHVERLKPYNLPWCQRCEAPGNGGPVVDRPVSVSAGGDQVDVWLCPECLGFYKGLTAGRERGHA